MSENVDITQLIKALDNTKNDGIINLTTRKIMEINLKILKELMLDRDTIIDFLRKLKGYKYVDELTDLKYGSYIRWMPITDPDNLTLNRCGIICDIKITKDDDVIISCKNFLHRYYTFKMDEVLIFQKLTTQEMVIISALDHLENETKQKGSVNKSKDNNKNSDNNNEEEYGNDDEDDDDDMIDAPYTIK
jgi:hypothetical protein